LLLSMRRVIAHFQPAARCGIFFPPCVASLLSFGWRRQNLFSPCAAWLPSCGAQRETNFFAMCRVIAQFRGAGHAKKAYDTAYSQAVTHPSTNAAQSCLTSVIGRELVFSTWYGRRHKPRFSCLAQRSWASPASLLSFVLLQEDSARARVRHCSVSRGALRCAFLRARACVRARVRACVRACVRARVGGWVRARACACVRARVGGGGGCVRASDVLRAPRHCSFSRVHAAQLHNQSISYVVCCCCWVRRSACPHVYMVGNANTPTAKGATLTKADI
jgi:hypothetical protein